MKLIAESGSMKTEWALVEGKQLLERVFTEGLNPFFQNRREISRRIRTGLPESFFKNKLECVHYYGAGCTSVEKKAIIEASLIAQFKTIVHVESDLLAAARGLFQERPGIACIIGAGSNSCHYNGRAIVKNVRSGGFILGDEGGGVAIGKRFVSDVLKNIAPQFLITEFYTRTGLNPESIMDAIYNHPHPNRFLSEQATFLAKYASLDYVNDLIMGELRNFFDRNLVHYDIPSYPVRFTGSVAYHFAPMLRRIGRDFGLSIDIIEQTPVDGLIRYHHHQSQQHR